MAVPASFGGGDQDLEPASGYPLMNYSIDPPDCKDQSVGTELAGRSFFETSVLQKRHD